MGVTELGVVRVSLLEATWAFQTSGDGGHCRPRSKAGKHTHSRVGKQVF